MQERAAGAGQPHDEEGLPDALCGDAGMARAVVHQPQAVGEERQCVPAGGQAAEQRQPRLRLEAPQEDAQRLAEFLAAEVVPAAHAASRLEKGVLVEADGAVAQALQDVSGCIERAQAGAQKGWRDRHDR